MSFLRIVGAAALALALTSASGCAAADSEVERLLRRIELPPGFAISLYARVPGARSMAVVEPGRTVFVGSRGSAVHMVVDGDGDGRADRVVRKAGRLDVPNGIAHDGESLYVAEQPRIVRFAGPAARGGTEPLGPPRTILAGLPDKSHHGWRYAGFGPDGRLYVSIGSPCNVCMPVGMEGTIIRLDRDGGNVETVARGIRNSVGFDWHPVTGEMFFTDNGSDGLGDDIPADELNRVTRTGQHFGYPWYGGGRTRTPDFEDSAPPADATAPAVEFQAHTASLGVHFYRGRMFPAEYRNDAFVAQHGSWNRSTPIGYRVMRVRFDRSGRPVGKEVFASGWLQGDDAWGRPVDVKELADGSLLVSDDRVGAIYRITYRGR